jgi:hypothetical protein
MAASHIEPSPLREDSILDPIKDAVGLKGVFLPGVVSGHLTDDGTAIFGTSVLFRDSLNIDVAINKMEDGCWRVADMAQIGMYVCGWGLEEVGLTIISAVASRWSISGAPRGIRIEADGGELFGIAKSIEELQALVMFLPNATRMAADEAFVEWQLRNPEHFPRLQEFLATAS